MSQFDNPEVSSSHIRWKNDSAFDVVGTVNAVVMDDGPGGVIDSPNDKPAVVTRARQGFAQKACFVTLCTYLLSGFTNELALRLIDTKAYISTVTLVLMPALLLLTGTAFRGIRVSFGKWWIAFGCWLAICAPFSVWRSDTAHLLLNYYFRSFLLYFVICACVLTLRRLRTLMYVLGFGNLLVVLCCFAFGSMENGRLSIPGSSFSFLSNANELGLQLLLGITTLLFALFRGGKFVKSVSAATVALSVVYMLKTGSRGVLVAALAVMLFCVLLSRKRIKILAAVLPLLAVVLLLLPKDTRHRLTYFAMGDDTLISNEEEASALGSQRQRQQLFWNSVRLTLEHPIFGVGPGEFIVEDAREAEKKGEYGVWRQTHNSYTQISSEAGIPGLIFYVCSLLACLSLNYRIYKQTAGKNGLEDYAVLSFCMLLSTIGYAVGTIFDHLAYMGYLPMIAGVTTACYLAARPTLQPNTPRPSYGRPSRSSL